MTVCSPSTRSIVIGNVNKDEVNVEIIFHSFAKIAYANPLPPIKFPHRPNLLLEDQHYQFDQEATFAFEDYIKRRRLLPFFANARSIRNALDRARLRQANRLFARMGESLSKEDLITLEASDIRASRVFAGEVEGHHPSSVAP